MKVFIHNATLFYNVTLESIDFKLDDVISKRLKKAESTFYNLRSEYTKYNLGIEDGISELVKGDTSDIREHLKNLKYYYDEEVAGTYLVTCKITGEKIPKHLSKLCVDFRTKTVYYVGGKNLPFIRDYNDFRKKLVFTDGDVGDFYLVHSREGLVVKMHPSDFESYFDLSTGVNLADLYNYHLNKKPLPDSTTQHIQVAIKPYTPFRNKVMLDFYGFRLVCAIEGGSFRIGGVTQGCAIIPNNDQFRLLYNSIIDDNIVPPFLKEIWNTPDFRYFYINDTEGYSEWCSSLGSTRNKSGRTEDYNTDVLSIIKGFKSNPFESRPVFMGVELEVVRSSRSGETFSNIIKKVAHSELGKNLIMKYDGSVGGDGMELVTCPMSLLYFKDLFRDHFFNEVNAFNKLVRPSKSCGLHIHIDKKSLTPRQLSNVIYFLSLSSNSKFIRSIGGRNWNSYCRRLNSREFDKKQMHKTVHRLVQTKKKNWKFESSSWDRYTMLNLKPAHTIEFRFFASTVKQNQLFYRAEFVHSILEFCKEAKTSKDLTKSKFCAWLVSSRDRCDTYSNLLNYLYTNKYVNREKKKNIKTNKYHFKYVKNKRSERRKCA